jgi:glycosyltransferase involved in cell wall biosynthesis
LVFVGQGDEERMVMQESARLGIAERVRMVGYQTDIPNWLAAATVWLLPTERENFSIAVLEALAAGCAILSTNCQGNDEVLVDGQNALTFAVGDVGEATEQLRRLLREPPLRARLSANARASAQAFSIPNVVEGYRTVYQRARDVPAQLRNSA